MRLQLKGYPLSVRLFQMELILILLFSVPAFSKSNEYYKEVIVSGVFDCDTKCKEHKLHYEVQDLTYRLIDKLLQKLSRDIDKKYKEEISD